MSFSPVRNGVLKLVVLQNVTVIYDMRIRPESRKNLLRKLQLYFHNVFFHLKPCLWCKKTPGQMPPEGITSHFDNYCSERSLRCGLESHDSRLDSDSSPKFDDLRLDSI